MAATQFVTPILIKFCVYIFQRTSLAIFTQHMRDRQLDRNIHPILIQEAVRDGLVMDQQGRRRLHVSDLIVVVSDQNIGITAFPNPLNGIWRTNLPDPNDPRIRILDNAYFFFQASFCLCPIFSLSLVRA
jgi:hypothetical protein